MSDFYHAPRADQPLDARLRLVAIEAIEILAETPWNPNVDVLALTGNGGRVVGLFLQAFDEDGEPEAAEARGLSHVAATVDQISKGWHRTSPDIREAIAAAVADPVMGLDAEEADVIAQVACFGEIVYG
jgi:hypothetical protein